MSNSDCQVSVAAFAASISSAFMCAETSAWKCKSVKKTAIILSISSVLTVAIHLLAAHVRLPGMVRQALFAFSTILPQIMFSIGDEVHCKNMKHVKNDWARYMSLYAAPLLVFAVTQSDYMHDLVCHAKIDKYAAGASTASRSFGASASRGLNKFRSALPSRPAPTPSSTPSTAADSAGSFDKAVTNHKTTVIPSKNSNLRAGEVNRLSALRRRSQMY